MLEAGNCSYVTGPGPRCQHDDGAAADRRAAARRPFWWNSVLPLPGPVGLSSMRRRDRPPGPGPGPASSKLAQQGTNLGLESEPRSLCAAYGTRRSSAVPSSHVQPVENPFPAVREQGGSRPGPAAAGSAAALGADSGPRPAKAAAAWLQGGGGGGGGGGGAPCPRMGRVALTSAPLSPRAPGRTQRPPGPAKPGPGRLAHGQLAAEAPR